MIAITISPGAAAPAMSPVVFPAFASVQRKCACGGSPRMSGDCAECSKKKPGLQTKLSGAVPYIQRFTGRSTGQADAAAASVDQALAGPGRPLEPPLRQDMEQRFGRDFSRVRVHVGARASESAAALGANAYTLGQHVVFGQGGFDPASGTGRRLIAHELAHTIQQRGSGHEPPGKAPAREREAGRTASRVADGGAVPALTPSGLAVACDRGKGLPPAENWQADLSIPQWQLDEANARWARMRWKVAPDPKPENTPPAGDIGCHTDPYKATRGQPACAAAHHKPRDAAADSVRKHMQEPVDFSEWERSERAQLDRLNEAYWHFLDTSEYIHRDEFSPFEIQKDRIIPTSTRWDMAMSASYSLEAARFDELYFRSKAEYHREWERRYDEYLKEFKACGHSRPSHFKCRDRVMAKYSPGQFAYKDAVARWAYRDMETAMPVLREGGPVAGAAFHVTHEWLGWSTDRSAAAGGFFGTWANLAGAKIQKDAAQKQSGGGSSGPDVSPPPPARVAPKPTVEPMPTPDVVTQSPVKRAPPVTAAPPVKPAPPVTAAPPVRPAPPGPGSDPTTPAPLGPAPAIPAAPSRTTGDPAQPQIADTQVAIALDRAAAGLPLTERQRLVVSSVSRADLQVPHNVKFELEEGGGTQVPFKVAGPVDPGTRKERKTILGDLQKAGVGKAGGTRDQLIVRQVLLTETPSGKPPVFITADDHIINGLARHAGILPEGGWGKYQNASEYLHYEMGAPTFEVVVQGRHLIVRPIQPIRLIVR